MITLLIATGNAHKVGEIRAILGNRFRYLTLNDFSDPPKVVEDAPTFAGNASKKAVALARWVSGLREVKPEFGGEGGDLLVLADDSGLEVDALGGAPGVHSARFAALDSGQSGNSSNAENNAKLLRLLDGVPAEKRTGRFRCVIALTPVARPAGELASQTRIFDGTCEGRIGVALRGQGGFGYDPLFLPEGYKETFAELGEEVKNRLSHRAKALAQLRDNVSSLISRPKSGI
jgi:XTP/dITP diphosphohydrolase